MYKCKTPGRVSSTEAAAVWKQVVKTLTGKAVLYFSPHQDDELLSMGIDICNSVIRGMDVHIILCTDGSKCSVRTQLANGRECVKHTGTHRYHLSEEEFITARDKEFRESCRALGVADSNVHIPEERFVDRKLTVCNSREMILKYLSSVGTDSIVCTLDPNLENSRQHRDHKALGYAAAELFNEGLIGELRLFTEPYNPECFSHATDFVRGKPVSEVDVPSLAIQEKLKRAVAAYSLWDPEAGRYAVGYHSIGGAFDELLRNGKSYCNVLKRETEALCDGINAGKCKNLVVSLTSDQTRIYSIVPFLETVYEQGVTPDAVILWLASSDFPDKEEDLPAELLKLKTENNLCICWSEADFNQQNIFKRIDKEYQDALVITVDDDIQYHNRIIENLYCSYLRHPKEASAARPHWIVNSLYYARYAALRIDIINKGDENCQVMEQSVTPVPVSVRRPGWLPNGITVESVAGRIKMAVQCVGDGQLEIRLMGRDMRNAEGKRYPVWIDCTFFAVNGETIFNETQTVCHDKRYVYRKAVKDGEVVCFEATWSECRSNTVLDDYRRLERSRAETLKKLDKAEQELKRIQKVQKEDGKKLDKAQKELKKKQAETEKTIRELKLVKSGWSYRSGRVITWLPRKIKEWFKK